MLIKDEQCFNINKLMLLFNIAWLLQLKKIPNNQLKMNENFFMEENKTGLVSKQKNCYSCFSRRFNLIIFIRTISILLRRYYYIFAVLILARN